MSQSSPHSPVQQNSESLDETTAKAAVTKDVRGAAKYPRLKRSGSQRPAITLGKGPVPRGFQGYFGVDVRSQGHLVEQIRAGFPIGVFESLSEALDISEKDLAGYTSITPRTLARRKTLGQLQPTESDRLSRIVILLDKAINLFEGNQEKAVHWLKTPKRALAGATPIGYSDTEPGVQEVLNLIGRLEHGVIS